MIGTNTYQLEKMIQHRLSEIDRNTRDGLYVKQASGNRGFWSKWFGSRRLGTS